MLKQAHAISEELIEWRRDFHMHPETGFDVQRTAGIVADELEKMGYRVKRGVGKTGVVAEIGEGGKMVAIRADMDALPIFEQNETDYVSQNTGKMHACGHDSHTAMALGAAHLLSKEKFKGRVRFLFQERPRIGPRTSCTQSSEEIWRSTPRPLSRRRRHAPAGPSRSSSNRRRRRRGWRGRSAPPSEAQARPPHSLSPASASASRGTAASHAA